MRAAAARAAPPGDGDAYQGGETFVEGLRTPMTVRTTSKTVTFMHPFSLTGTDEVQPAGTYTVETDEELLYMCGIAMRDAVAPPGSKATSRPKGTRRNLRGLMSGHRLQSRLVRIGKVRNRSR